METICAIVRAFGRRRADFLGEISNVGSAYPYSCCRCLKKDRNVESTLLILATDNCASRNVVSNSVIVSGTTSARGLLPRNFANLDKSLL